MSSGPPASLTRTSVPRLEIPIAASPLAIIVTISLFCEASLTMLGLRAPKKFDADEIWSGGCAYGDFEPVAIPAIAADITNGNGAQAVARATRLRDANRGVADAHILLGDAALAAGRFDVAVQAYRTARDLDAVGVDGAVLDADFVVEMGAGRAPG